MKQITYSLSKGIISIEEVPIPKISPNNLLIKTNCSLISSGTERMLIDFGKSNLIQKAQKQPEKLNEVINKFITDGIYPTISAVTSKLDQPIKLGYCNAGTVVAVGDNVDGFKIGDRVVSNGPHSDYVLVPKLLCSKIPDNVSFKEAVFTVIGSVGLQGIRLANATLGETFLVSGLGLLGIITCQILKANGCKVLGIDPDLEKIKFAKSLNIETLHLTKNSDPVSWAYKMTSLKGLDGAFITASTSSSDPIDIAANSCRKKGRIILLGVTGMELKRSVFYKKELSFQVSCSYGPGRYDSQYEQDANDYPLPYVRWTAQRNFEAILYSISNGSINTKPLTTKIFDICEARSAYDHLTSQQTNLGILLTYDQNTENIKEETNQKIIKNKNYKRTNTNSKISVIGAGNYASRILIPNLKKAGGNLETICSSDGSNPTFLAKKFNFKFASTDTERFINDDVAEGIVITTRHDSHAELVQSALKAGKKVFLEKPLCLNNEELLSIKNLYYQLYAEAKVGNCDFPFLMMGFNRRFANLVVNLKKSLDNISAPKSFIYTCNAGYLPKDHWLNQSKKGGGRLIGEACHFVDLLLFLSGSRISNIEINALNDKIYLSENFTINLRFFDGSIGAVHYMSNGSKSYPKERIEVFSGGKVLRLDNFRKLSAWGIKGFSSKRSFIQDKGNFNCAKTFISCLENNKESPISPEEIFSVQSWLLKINNASS